MIENIRDISSYFNVRKKVRKAYEQVIDESPRDLNGLSEKYSFNPKDKINVHGCFSNLYSVEKGKVGKVIYKERNGSFFHGMVDSLEKSFDVTMYEFNKLKLASFLDVPVSETYEVILAKNVLNEELRCMLVMRDLGRVTLGEYYREDYRGDYKLAISSWEDAKSKLRRFLAYEPIDLNESNAIWVPEDKQTYLIDSAFWDFKGLPKYWYDANNFDNNI
ncbi:MAG: hypothetical protein QT05_C0048G0029 [archaeon GW2011_AR13]|nr:MAG: hypothetical protein QT05_C0048G0029 [archaeon GW2011_AR13]HIG94112.1 hypothetical protein [Nanoarchaeota archaeon]HIH63959.1 hypothetical protein [Nanoarchaeota archaeon]HIJ09699.1 hypothetical protein [Nanoarchaeota archaeon]